VADFIAALHFNPHLHPSISCVGKEASVLSGANGMADPLKPV
jgi:hypothetical protein